MSAVQLKICEFVRYLSSLTSILYAWAVRDRISQFDAIMGLRMGASGGPAGGLPL